MRMLKLKMSIDSSYSVTYETTEEVKSCIIKLSSDIDGDYLYVINGRYLSEYKLMDEIKFGNRIPVYNAKYRRSKNVFSSKY